MSSTSARLAQGTHAEGATPPATSEARKQIQVWDAPLRVFHWTLVAAVTTAIVTGKAGGSWMEWHARAGIATAGLLTFRLAWGLFGSGTARFVQFVPGPGTVLAYLRGRWQGIGHNPLGACSVLALLGVLGLQVGSGLVGNDDIAFAGPLAALISEEASHRLTNLHHVVADALLYLLALHIAAIAFYTLNKKKSLVRPMLNGRLDVPASQSEPKRAAPLALVVSLALAVAAMYGASGVWMTPQTNAETSKPVTPATTTPAW